MPSRQSQQELRLRRPKGNTGLQHSTTSSTSAGSSPALIGRNHRDVRRDGPVAAEEDETSEVRGEWKVQELFQYFEAGFEEVF